jgi:ParB-like chromosome segregation protein Spo0J
MLRRQVTVPLPRKALSRPMTAAPRPGDCEIVQLLALAHAVERATQDGVATRAQIARALGYTRARLTQICALAFLAPDIQAELIDRAPSERISERALRLVARELEWSRQRAAWRALVHLEPRDLGKSFTPRG